MDQINSIQVFYQGIVTGFVIVSLFFGSMAILSKFRA